jgi:hypothetical protein
MQRRRAAAVAAVLLLAGACKTPARAAAALEVSPVLLDVPAPGATAPVSLVEQSPEAGRSGRAKVSTLLRQVLPVFFAEADRTPRATNCARMMKATSVCGSRA